MSNVINMRNGPPHLAPPSVDPTSLPPPILRYPLPPPTLCLIKLSLFLSLARLRARALSLYPTLDYRGRSHVTAPSAL
jgi:hypothetical protein